MKKFWKATLAIFVLAVLAYALTSYLESRRSLWHRLKNPETVQKLKQFVAVQAAQANADTNGVPPEIRSILKLAERGDWLALSHSISDLDHWSIGWEHGWQHDMEHDYWRPNGLKMAVKYVWCRVFTRNGIGPDYLAPPDMNGACGKAIYEIENAFDVFWNVDEKFLEQFGREVITSIPPGSIYLGGDGAGRFVPTVMLAPLSDKSSFYILPQMAFRSRDVAEMERLQRMYGNQVQLLAEADFEQCLRDYLNSLRSHQTNITDDYGIMGMAGLAIQRLVATNSQREFFISEEYPIVDIFPQLEPHGLIVKINPHPIEKLSDDIVQQDHDFWVKETRPLIGDWLKDETSIQEIAVFAKKIFGERNFTGFTGDPDFIHDKRAQELFVLARCNTANIFAWRAKMAKDEVERMRMARAADFAFRQAWAMRPCSSIAYSYANFLLSQVRFDDAILLMETYASLPDLHGDEMAASTISKLKQFRAEYLSKLAK